MKPFWLAAIGVTVAGIALAISKPAKATEVWLTKVTKGKMTESLVKAARKINPKVIESARKWASARGLPLFDVLATILLESRGVPTAHLLNDKEDSRGLMQVNVRAWHPLIVQLGFTDQSLFQIEPGLAVGTHILAQSRKAVEKLVKECPAEQYHDISTLTRLYYAGPAYVAKMLKKAKEKKDTVHPFKNAERYVDRWHEAMTAINEVFGKGGNV